MTEPMGENKRIVEECFEGAEYVNPERDGEMCSISHAGLKRVLVEALNAKDSIIQAKEAEIERLMKLEGYRQEQLLSLRTLVEAKDKEIADVLASRNSLREIAVGLGKASRLLFLSVVDEWMRDENEPNEEIHPSVSDGVIKYREIIALIPEELRKEIDEKV